MPMYVFHPVASDGRAKAFEALALPDRQAAMERARRMVMEGDTVEVEVWCEDQVAFTLSRTSPYLP